MCAAAFLWSPHVAHAQAEVLPDEQTMEKARVIRVENAHTRIIPGTDTEGAVQTITASILEGPRTGTAVTFENDYIQLKENEVFYLRHLTSKVDGTDYYTVSDPYRLNVLLALLGIFVLLIAFFGGIQGVRGFASMCGSIILIFYVLVPGILGGYSPITVSIGVASLIIILGSYITHGFNRTTSAAVIGMILTVLVTGLGAYIAVHTAHLSGFSSEENVYLNFNTRGAIDMLGLLFGAIMIGLLGVLYDVAIGQAIAVEELFRAGEHMTRFHVYTRGIRIGREHIGALVNTLAIAYVGASLPLLLLVYHSTFGVMYALNSELFATEIIRILIGSIGLILAVPITTLIASYMLSESYAVSRPHTEHGHTHSHTH